METEVFSCDSLGYNIGIHDLFQLLGGMLILFSSNCTFPYLMHSKCNQKSSYSIPSRLLQHDFKRKRAHRVPIINGVVSFKL